MRALLETHTDQAENAEDLAGNYREFEDIDAESRAVVLRVTYTAMRAA